MRIFVHKRTFVHAMNMLDIIVWLVLAVAVFNGWRKGLIGKIFSLGGLVAGIWLALSYGPQCGKALQLEGRAADIVGFLVLLVVTLIVAGIIGRIVAKACSTIGLGGVNALLGILLGIVEGVLLLGLLFTAVDYFAPKLIAPETRSESKCYGPIMQVADTVFPPLSDYARRYLPETDALPDLHEASGVTPEHKDNGKGQPSTHANTAEHEC